MYGKWTPETVRKAKQLLARITVNIWGLKLAIHHRLMGHCVNMLRH